MMVMVMVMLREEGGGERKATTSVRYVGKNTMREGSKGRGVNRGLCFGYDVRLTRCSRSSSGSSSGTQNDAAGPWHGVSRIITTNHC